MTRRIFKSICLAALAVLIGAVVVIMGALYNYFSDLQRRQLAMQTSLTSQAVTAEGVGFLEGLTDIDTRITLIDADGSVLYDSHTDSQTMENHLEREEIRQALETGTGYASRYSDTLAEQFIYTAQRLPDGSVLRLSMTQYSTMALVMDMAEPILIIIILAVILALWMASRLSRSIVRPLNELNLDDPMANSRYEELNPLLRRIDSQQRQLKGQKEELKRKQREFDTVTNSMDEGLVLLNDRGIVLTMNPAAARIMGLSRPFVGINIHSVTQDGMLDAVVDKALSGHRAEANYSMLGGEYQAEANPVKTSGGVSGIVLLLLDVTEKRRAETQRREFTANVSHELKTPLHAISGYAELMKSGMVRSEDVTGFAGNIYTEAQRLIRLVEDILKLSRLDEGADGKRENLDLYDLVRQTLDEMKHYTSRNNVTLTVTGESAPMVGVPGQIRMMVGNLFTNACKYNNPGGRVDVNVSRAFRSVVLTVSDTGIGIAEEHQERIFERFYRVDKSHSKAVGGTGLGLSIVKHAAMIHNAKIELESQPGEGTTIRVIFPI
ncbi:MAG: PAS domain S-box protein [Oscillospiraceae bacterium]|nr:PAS domain S-box protein [Oscillospiraceae bacterium]